MDNPCYDKKTKTSCSKRCAGCLIGCQDWADYVMGRNQHYSDLHEQKSQMNLIDSYECSRTKRIQRGKHKK